jgi:hypothetical protein
VLRGTKAMGVWTRDAVTLPVDGGVGLPAELAVGGVVTVMGAVLAGASVIGGIEMGEKVVGDTEIRASVTLQLGDEQSPKMTKETVTYVSFTWRHLYRYARSLLADVLNSGICARLYRDDAMETLQLHFMHEIKWNCIVSKCNRFPKTAWLFC